MSAEKEPPYASTAAVAGLAREVEALRRSVDAVRALPAQVDELARVVGVLAEETAARAGSRVPVIAPSWLDSPGDIAHVRDVLTELTGWLGEVYLRYADGCAGLPDCWLWHPDIVEELVWLMYGWVAAYRAENASVALAGDWHDRYRPGVVRRIKGLAGPCSLENHQPRGDRKTGGAPVVPLAEAIAPIADWWATRRADTPPEPSEQQLAAVIASQRRAGGGRR